MKQLKIGNIILENSYILGPMAGVTDLPFRLLCKEQGARTDLYGNDQCKRNLIQQ